MKHLRNLSLHHQLVFLRADFNVPLGKDGGIADDARLRAMIPTIRFCQEHGARLVIASHLGRPKGKIVEELRLAPVAARLAQLLGTEVHTVNDCIGERVDAAKSALKPGEILLLENLRFYEEEEKNDLHFAECLARDIDVYVNDAFGTLHRAHASIVALPTLIFEKGMGLLIEKELAGLDCVITEPAEPLVIVIGGKKISDKVSMIRHLAPRAAAVLVGGGVANTFLQGMGTPMQGSLIEEADGMSTTELAAELYHQFDDERDDLVPGMSIHHVQLPIDLVVAPSPERSLEARVVTIGKEHVPESWMALDIGPATSALYAGILRNAKTIFWNGPMGMFEHDAFAKGTQAVAIAIAHADAITVLGGGDTERVVDQFDLAGKFHHVSTGGGASLYYLAGKDVPGLRALE